MIRIYTWSATWIYQGKNGANVGIHHSVKDLPTTQKALANSLKCAMVSNNTMGYRTFYSDNRYSSIELSILMREKVKILTSGTIRKNSERNG